MHQITDCNHCAIHPERMWHNPECLWIFVPKNANMMMRKICADFGMHRTKDRGQHSKYSVCIVRNPYTRLISGFGEYSKRNRDRRPLAELLEHFADDPSGFDEHLEPQLFYLQSRSYTHILKFENLLDDLLLVPYFSTKPDVINKHLKPQRLQKSKHYSKSLEHILSEHSVVIDSIVHKYFSRDLHIWQNTDKYRNNKVK